MESMPEMRDGMHKKRNLIMILSMLCVVYLLTGCGVVRSIAYIRQNREEAEIAARLGISLRQAKTVLGDLARLETYKKRSEAAKLRAQICVNKSAEEAARRQAALLLDGEVNETISQRAAKDILDRAGVRVPKESRSDVVIRFAQGAPPLGMPESAEKGKEERHGA